MVGKFGVCPAWVDNVWSGVESTKMALIIDRHPRKYRKTKTGVVIWSQWNLEPHEIL